MSELPKPSDINQAIDTFFTMRAEIFAHVGYVEDWRVLPLDDSREMFWNVDPAECQTLRFSASREAIEYWVAQLKLGHDDYGEYGMEVYQDVIYTQRHLPKWVYRGELLTMVVADTQTDGNKYLKIFANDREVK